ncbi:hypothetical protein [Pedobacter metabolipauper]|uniref:Very-short-patch-repair endonuclease n=1 Tax=Pedobacter metabolipauper TaxID=425513 RepID=A0A4V3D1S2_9SPHI|nr:hypothetical protein [Pedobacter metabolipauper]TDQ12193.1 hypothetical protein ATK78_1327 [Pedobacter metabolipauper]
MKSSTILKAVYKDCLERGYVLNGDQLLPPNHPEAIRILNNKSKRRKRVITHKTGWVDDDRNIKNKDTAADMFMKLVKIELGLDVWPEFFFSTDRLYRFDYVVPVDVHGKVLKIAIEQEGGIWAKGNSGHSSGTGIQRDMDKNNLAIAQGWVIIRRTPTDLCTMETINLIKSIINQRNI